MLQRHPILAALSRAIVVAMLFGMLPIATLAQTDQSDDEATSQPTSQPAPTHTLKDFLGTWTGKWDDTWAVRFTITPGHDADHVSVVYEWEETVGQPMRKSETRGTLNDNVLRTGRIRIRLNPGNPDRATAIGNFSRRKKAKLTREKPPKGE